MSQLTQIQTKRLAELAHLLRPGWDVPGIEAAIRKAAEKAPALVVARATLNLAANADAVTPGMLPLPGRHWPVDDAGVSLLPTSHNVRCPEHPLSVMPCPQCEAKRTPPPTDDPEYAAMKAALKARTRPQTEQQRLASFNPRPADGSE